MSDERVTDRATGRSRAFRMVRGPQARAEREPDAEPTTDDIRVTPA